MLTRKFSKNLIYIPIILFILVTLIFSFLLSPINKMQHSCYKLNSNSLNLEGCWTNVANKIVRAKGVKVSLDYSSKFLKNDPKFGEVCHEYLHQVGHFAYPYYWDYLDGKPFDLPKGASSCGNGFYHGLMSSVLSQGVSVDDAKDFCTYLNDNFGNSNPDLLVNCYHGIGHGLVTNTINWNSPKSDISQNIDKCKSIGVGYEECVSAVFADVESLYISQVLTKNGSFYYEHSIEEFEHLFDICKLFPEYKNECASNFVYGVDNSKPLSVQLNAGLSLDDPDLAVVVIRIIAKTYSRKSDKKSTPFAINDCMNLTNKIYKEQCLIGLVWGKLETVGSGKEFDEGYSFCSAEKVEKESRNHCYEALIKSMQLYYSASELDVKNYCKTINDNTISLCKFR